MNIAAIIIGIENWQRFTLPLIESIRQHEPDCRIVVVDNDSKEPYPTLELNDRQVQAVRTSRCSYSSAINIGKESHGLQYEPDWVVVLSNDVLCTGPFADVLAGYGDGDLLGPLLKHIDIERVGRVDYLEGWCVCIPSRIWNDIGGWDDGMKISSYEDVEYSHRARVNGFGLIEETDLPFTHLDQKQRFYLVPDYWSSEHHNRARFVEKYTVKP